jgi:hypothetical protein
MSRLNARFPDFGDIYDKLHMRELVRHLETLFSQVIVDTSRGAYAVTGNTTLGSYDEVVLVDTSAGDVTITLPAISDAMVRLKQEYELVKTVSANTLHINPTGADTIVGDANVIVTVQWTALRFRATPGDWVII